MGCGSSTAAPVEATTTEPKPANASGTDAGHNAMQPVDLSARDDGHQSKEAGEQGEAGWWNNTWTTEAEKETFIQENLTEDKFRKECLQKDYLQRMILLANDEGKADGETSKLRGAAIQAIATVISTDNTLKDDERAHEELRRIAERHLDSDNPVLRSKAIASFKCFGKRIVVDDPLVTRLLKVMGSSDSPQTQYCVSEVLPNIPRFESHPDFTPTLKRIIDDSSSPDYLLNSVLFRAQHHARNLDGKGTLRPGLKSLLTHPSAPVRARAAVALSCTVEGLKGTGAGGDEETVAAAEDVSKLLDDSEPVVRSLAADAVSRIRYMNALPRIIELLDDSSSCRSIIEFVSLEEKKEKVRVDGAVWSRVDDAMLSAVQAMTVFAREHQWQKGKIDYKNVGGDIAAQVAACKDWWEGAEAALVNREGAEPVRVEEKPTEPAAT